MTGSPGVSDVSCGWWGIDVAGYLLTQLDAFAGRSAPQELDPQAVVNWIRENEMKWAPGASDPASTIPWSRLQNCQNDGKLVDLVIGQAADELNASLRSGSIEKDSRFLAARRLIPLSTLHAYGLDSAIALPPHNAPLADGHVHQGAALPLEVTLRWVALSTNSLPRSCPALMLEDTAKRRFNPQPLLLLLRNLITRPLLIDDEFIGLAVSAAIDSGDAWSKFNAKAAFEVADVSEPLSMTDIGAEKKLAFGAWTELRRISRLRVEAVLLGAITQRRAGLDSFVQLFEQFSELRRGRLPKPKYIQVSIDTHARQSNFRLRRLELRLGERTADADSRHNQNSLERTYADAFAGYAAQIRGKDLPIRVTFPLSLIKSPARDTEGSEHWRFDPGGICRLTESMLDLLEKHQSARPFIDGIDVAGLETAEPNWLFACAFQRFAAATASYNPPPSCRFHAGESQWTPLHGLRRIGEFMSFKLPHGTPIRVGHGLALDSIDWRRLGEQPLDELLDDLVWVRSRLKAMSCAIETERQVERLILDLRRIVYLTETARVASADELVDAYESRFDLDSLLRISFLNADRGRLSFPDCKPAPRKGTRSKLLVAHLSKGGVCSQTVEAALQNEPSLSRLTISDIQTTLLELYDLLAPEVVDDLRWSSVVVEACPTSNVLAGGVPGYARHPMRSFVRSGLLTTINTDDPSIFHSWLPDEYAHAEQMMAVSKRDIERSRELSMRVVAPGLEGIQIDLALADAIRSLNS